MLTVTKRFHFCYGHYLPKYEGACSNQHGHNSCVEVEFTGVPGLPGKPVEKYKGMVLDFAKIKEIVGPVIDELDHQFLNGFMPIPTAENIALFIRDRIWASYIGKGLIRVKVTETPDSWAEWRKDD